jgi:hypothetical protein
MEGEGGGGYSLRNLSLSLISFEQHRETSTTASFCKQLERKKSAVVSFRFVLFFSSTFFSSSKESALTNQMKRSREKLLLKKGAHF